VSRASIRRAVALEMLAEVIAFLRAAPSGTEERAKADLARSLAQHPGLRTFMDHRPYQVGALTFVCEDSARRLEAVLESLRPTRRGRR